MKKTSKPQKSGPIALTALEAANQALTPAIEYAAPGGKHSAIAIAMTMLTGQPVNRQMVGRWLNPDPAKREQPRFGYAIMLLWAVELCRRAEASGATPETVGAHGTIEVSVELSRPAIGDKNVRVGILTGSTKADATPPALRSSRRVASLKTAIELTGAQTIKGNGRGKALPPIPQPMRQQVGRGKRPAEKAIVEQTKAAKAATRKFAGKRK